VFSRQLARLLESLGSVQVAPPKPAVMERSDDKQSHENLPPVQRESEKPCKQEAEKLVKLRANPCAPKWKFFARDLHCRTLRPQVARLPESLGD